VDPSLTAVGCAEDCGSYRDVGCAQWCHSCYSRLYGSGPAPFWTATPSCTP